MSNVHIPITQMLGPGCHAKIRFRVFGEDLELWRLSPERPNLFKVQSIWQIPEQGGRKTLIEGERREDGSIWLGQCVAKSGSIIEICVSNPRLVSARFVANLDCDHYVSAQLPLFGAK